MSPDTLPMAKTEPEQPSGNWLLGKAVGAQTVAETPPPCIVPEHTLTCSTKAGDPSWDRKPHRTG